MTKIVISKETEVRRQKSEVRRRKTEDRRQKTEISTGEIPAAPSCDRSRRGKRDTNVEEPPVAGQATRSEH